MINRSCILTRRRIPHGDDTAYSAPGIESLSLVQNAGIFQNQAVLWVDFFVDMPVGNHYS